MATAQQLRKQIAECARSALQREPTNAEARALCFVAYLAGAMAYHGESAIQGVLNTVAGRKNSATDGA